MTLHPDKQFWPPHAYRFFSGGSAPNVAATPVAAAVPPVTESSPEVAQAQADYRRQMLRKKGFSNSTIFAPDTGGFFPKSPSPSPTNPKPASQSVGPGAKSLGT